MKKYSVLGYYGRDNCGDDALQYAVWKIFEGHGDVTLFNPDSKGALPDQVVLGGGDVVNPYFLDKLEGRKGIKILGAGLGYSSELDLLTAPGFVSEALFRNKIDTDLAKEGGLNARYTPDLAFALDIPRRKKFPPIDKGKKKLLAVLVADNVSQSFMQKDVKQISYGTFLKSELALAITHIRDYYKVVFIPMSHARYAYDVKMIYEILSFMPPQDLDHIVYHKPISPVELTELLAEMDLVISMRFHGLILSTLAGVPFINIGLSKKTQTFANENALGDLNIEPYTMTRDLLVEKIAKAEDALVKLRVEHARDQNVLEIQETIRYIHDQW